MVLKCRRIDIGWRTGENTYMRAVVLPCGCHKVTSEGYVYSRIRQFSVKGVYGIQTEYGKRWRRLGATMRKDSGYLQVGIHGRPIRVNRLVASTFVPNPLAMPEAQHKDGNRSNNRASNLKWGTPFENAQDRERHGRTSRGNNNPSAKLNPNRVKQIRSLRLTGLSFAKIGKRFGVSKKLVMLVIQRKIWKHVV